MDWSYKEDRLIASRIENMEKRAITYGTDMMGEAKETWST